MRLFFFAGKCIPIHAASLEERALGGTETGLIRVAKLLSDRGHDVTVFTSHPGPPQSTPVYLPAGMIQQAGACDVLIAVQDWWSLFYGVPAKRKVYWTGDGPDQFMTFGIGDGRIRDRIDQLAVVSTWQRDELCGLSGFPQEKAFIVRNGVHAPYFDGSETRDRKRLLFTSAPYRGLDLAIAYYKILKQKHPDLSLHAFSGFALYERDEKVPYHEKLKAEYEMLKAQVQQIPDVHLHENVTQAALAREYMRSGIFFYPAKVPETFCITAIEAQAAGCPVVTSAIGALEETVGDAGVAVHGTPGSELYAETFLTAADRLLSDPTAWEKLSARAQARVGAEYHWEHVTDRFEQMLDRVMAGGTG